MVLRKELWQRNGRKNGIKKKKYGSEMVEKMVLRKKYGSNCKFC